MVVNHRFLTLLGAVLFGAVVVAAIAIGSYQPCKVTNLLDGVLPRTSTYPSDQFDRGRWETHRPQVNGRPLILPEDAILVGTGKAHHLRAYYISQGLTPLQPPLYMIVRDGEVASVSGVNGEFLIGMDHECTFEFLINQFGRDKMQLVPTEFYEKRWGPFRADYIRED